MLPGWSSDPYVIVKLCEKKEELEKFQTKTVGNDTNPEFDESHKFKGLKHPGKLKLKSEIWDSVSMPRLRNFAAAPPGSFLLRRLETMRVTLARRTSGATTRSATVISPSATSRLPRTSRILRLW